MCINYIICICLCYFNLKKGKNTVFCVYVGGQCVLSGIKYVVEGFATFFFCLAQFEGHNQGIRSRSTSIN